LLKSSCKKKKERSSTDGEYLYSIYIQVQNELINCKPIR